MIEIKDLSAGYDLNPKQRENARKPVVSVPETCFSEGQITCIIGKNGCGKSTLLKTLLGLLPYQGSIRLFGEELRTLKPKERAARVGYLPQTLTLPKMSVYTLAAHGCFRRKKMFQTLAKSEREKIEAALDAADMSEYRDKTVSELSGGERQRAFLAMLMSQDPAFFLLDEVTSYMDVEHQKKTTEIVRRLAASGKGVVMTTHDLALLAVHRRKCVVRSFSCARVSASRSGAALRRKRCMPTNYRTDFRFRKEEFSWVTF